MKFLIDILANGVTDAAGLPLNAGTVTFYEPGTTTPKTAYAEFALSTPLDNPATLDTAGRITAFCNERVKLLIKNSAGTTIHTFDNVGISDAQVGTSIAGNAAGNGLDGSGGTLDVNTDNVSTELNSDTVRLKALGITAARITDGAVTETKISSAQVTTAKIQDAAVTLGKIAAIGAQYTASSGTFSSTTSAYADIFSAVSFTTTGRLVCAMLQSDASLNGSYFSYPLGAPHLSVKIVRDSTTIGEFRFHKVSSSDLYIPTSSVKAFDTVAAGTYNYKAAISSSDNTSSGRAYYCKLVVFEL